MPIVMDNQESPAVKRIFLDDREIILLGTAHISQESVDEVRHLIPFESPDVVCVELDRQRFQSLRESNRWQSLNIIQVIKKGQLPYLMVNLALSSFQKRMGLQTGVKPGAEMAAAAETAEQEGIRLELIDRDIRTTLLRAWRKTSWWKKLTLLSTFLAGFFEKQQIDEEQLKRLKETDTLSAMLKEMGEILPSVKTILVDERDRYMAYQLRHCPGQKILAVVGAAHVPGIRQLLEEGYDGADLAEISRIPAKSTLSRILPWILPLAVILLFVLGFTGGEWEKASEAALAWILANGLLASLGTTLALGHPLTIASAFVAAPITSLNPMIGAGFVTALVQACVVPPTVKDMEAVGSDIGTFRGWWKNRMTRVMLVFLLSSLGSSVGTLVSFHWLKNLL
ncbi:MAG: TraB/GumN family protein [Desulfuromonadaceae bacterium]|nr:TraB/GumN family protein [Desulfuromonadaceae bacterium]